MIVLMKCIQDYMGNMNSVEVVHNTEFRGRAIHAVELQPGNLGAFIFVFLFAMLSGTILNGFYPNGLSLMGGLLISVCEQNHLDSDRIYYCYEAKLALESFGDISLQALYMLGAQIIARKLKTSSTISVALSSQNTTNMQVNSLFWCTGMYQILKKKLLDPYSSSLSSYLKDN